MSVNQIQQQNENKQQTTCLEKYFIVMWSYGLEPYKLTFALFAALQPEWSFRWIFSTFSKDRRLMASAVAPTRVFVIINPKNIKRVLIMFSVVLKFYLKENIILFPRPNEALVCNAVAAIWITEIFWSWG